MPIPKAKKEQRAKLGLCTLCDEPRTIRDDGKPATLCKTHLDYFRRYQRNWRAENGPARHNRCTICRSLEHNASDCNRRPS